MKQRIPPSAVSVVHMQRIDAEAIHAFGIPRLLLMEHAGLALARAVQAHQPASPTAPIVLCCGTGYNGGDGLSAGRHLHMWGYPLRVLLLGPQDRLRDEPATYATILQRLGVPLVDCTAAQSEHDVERTVKTCTLMVDALLGIGLQGPVREPFVTLIHRMNRSGRPIIAADIPSGLDADTGAIHGAAVKATATVAFGLPKRGCFLRDGPRCTGSLTVDPITFPPALLEQRQHA